MDVPDERSSYSRDMLRSSASILSNSQLSFSAQGKYTIQSLHHLKNQRYSSFIQDLLSKFEVTNYGHLNAGTGTSNMHTSAPFHPFRPKTDVRVHRNGPIHKSLVE